MATGELLEGSAARSVIRTAGQHIAYYSPILHFPFPRTHGLHDRLRADVVQVSGSRRNVGVSKLLADNPNVNPFRSHFRSAGMTQTMRVDYALYDFNAGSTANYEAYLGNDLITSGSFTWTGTDENYIGIFTNLSGRQARMDNLTITAIPEPATMALLALGGLAVIRRRK